MRIDSNSGASEMSRVNGHGFNFDVAPSLRRDLVSVNF